MGSSWPANEAPGRPVEAPVRERWGSEPTHSDWIRWLATARAAIPTSGLCETVREDIAQEVLLAFVAKRRAIRDPVAWLRHVARVQFLKHLRGKYRRRERDTVSLSAPEGGELDLRAREARGDVTIDLDRALARLPDELTTILLLTTRDGLSADEAAEREGISRGEVYLRKRRAVRRLRRDLE